MISYEGKKPYAYISFAPEDNALVTPVLEELSARGYRIWFDNGSELPEDKLAKLSKCTVMLAFVTPAYQDSTACRRELYYALDCNKPVLGIAPELVIKKFKTNLPVRFENPKGEYTMNGCIIK